MMKFETGKIGRQAGSYCSLYHYRTIFNVNTQMVLFLRKLVRLWYTLQFVASAIQLLWTSLLSAWITLLDIGD